ncbi:MAG: hypothetical protein JNJ75_16810 [Cyclobacteriaceae bacterium]|nr:hypothetical protein [Cyclobacteriaceae bacterium]
MKKTFLTFVTLVMLTQCADDSLVKPTKFRNDTSIQKIIEVSIQQEQQLNNVLDKAGFVSRNNGRTSSTTGFQIDTEHILKVLQDDSTRHIYTFDIENSYSGQSFANLIIEEQEGGYLAYILEYVADSIRLSSADFNGSIRRLDLSGVLLSEQRMNAGRMVLESESGRLFQEPTCVKDVILETYCLEESTGGDVPLARAQAGTEVCWDVAKVIEGPCANNNKPEDNGNPRGTFLPGSGISGGGSTGNGSALNCKCPGSSSGVTEVGVVVSLPAPICPKNFEFVPVTTNNLWQEAALSNAYVRLVFSGKAFVNVTVKLPTLYFGLPYYNVTGKLVYSPSVAKDIAADVYNDAERALVDYFKKNPYLTEGQYQLYWIGKLRDFMNSATGGLGRVDSKGSINPSRPIIPNDYQPCNP